MHCQGITTCGHILCIKQCQNIGHGVILCHLGFVDPLRITIYRHGDARVIVVVQAIAVTCAQLFQDVDPNICMFITFEEKNISISL